MSNKIFQITPSLILILWGLFCIIAALIHLFVPDGGTASIAGLETNHTLIGIFAWVGATQLVWGLMMILTALKYRHLTSVILGLILLERILITINAWFIKPPTATGHQPPEVYITLYILPFLFLSLILSLRKK